MIQGRESLSQQEWWLEASACCNPKGQILCDCCHSTNGLEFVSMTICSRAKKFTIVGSVTGHCAALRMQLSKLPSYVSYPPKVSAKNRAFILPFSKSLARSIQYFKSRLCAERSFGFFLEIQQLVFGKVLQVSRTFHCPGLR